MTQATDPTPQEIAEACGRIRAGWTDAEREKRIVGKLAKVSAPVVAVRDIAAAAK